MKLLLYAGYAWIALDLILRAAGSAGGSSDSTVLLLALGPGAIGGLIIGVMVPVALGQTGRAPKLSRILGIAID